MYGLACMSTLDRLAFSPHNKIFLRITRFGDAGWLA